MTGGLVTFGETMALFTPPTVGRLRHAGSLMLGIGGAESNVAIGVARLGLPAAWFGRVGADELGETVLTRIRGEGVDVDAAVRDSEVPTSLMIKERPQPGIARVTYYRQGGPGARLRPSDVDESVLRGAQILHLTGITPALSDSACETVRASVELARTLGVLVSLDVNYRAALWPAERATPVLRELVRHCDVLFAGDDEAELLGVTGAPEVQARRLAGLGPREVVIKLGARGAVGWVDGAPVAVDALPVEAIDAVGAGDAFVAGYLAELMSGEPVTERLATAAACGACAVSVPGDWEGFPHRDELSLLTSRHGTVIR
ncbi:sugar kinase [Prauserella endophytica]|uniref:Sugar kinase n=1 Tax=Prauserella endophytica TaxID=1592324 RepID=A0ABY2RSS0_9PSEU|nr:sugar kinase [Prauserella endophytica]TKG58805.1 sugar kinase [Prauserella endophytica]